MRSRSLRRLTAAAGVATALALVARVRAEDDAGPPVRVAATEDDDGPPVRVALTVPDVITAGDRFEVSATVHVASAEPRPLLVTPRAEGTAVDVVRGRLLRADADSPQAMPLRFRVPLIARSAGTAVLRVTVSTYVCELRCAPTNASASVVLAVRAP